MTKKTSSPILADQLYTEARVIEAKFDEFAADPTIANMKELNGAWARGRRALDAAGG